MATRRAAFLVLIAAASSPTSILASAAAGPDGEARVVPPSTVVIELRLDGRQMRRPAVELDHAAHTSALGVQACTQCHATDENGVLDPGFVAVAGVTEWDLAMDAAHGACIGCHAERAAAAQPGGPVTCGECHVRRPAGRSTRAEMTFDYSLHGRHSLAYPEKCETCHHVRDEEKDALVYLKGAEAACRTCHGDRAVDDTPSRAVASHRACVSCHLQRARDGLGGGPVLCVGCHDRERLGQIARLEEVPRLLRGQPDRTWVAAVGGSSRAVPFDHLRHESQTSSCSECHHANLEPCDACHTLVGSEKGGGVSLADAYHAPGSGFSCVGCHRTAAGDAGCRGCHAGGTGQAADSSCTVCHAGPMPAAMGEEPPEVKLAEVSLGELPADSEELPETVVIDILVDRYEASKLPHGKIVRRLHGAVLDSRLAKRFHGRLEAGCAGCHHHSPVGVRPPRCASCHGGSAHPTRDQPALKAAYHRQCIGCHELMEIKALGCTDCHAAREVES